MRKVLNRKVAEQGGKCVIRPKEFTHYSDIVPDHTESQREWEEPGAMIIRRTFKPHTGGATKKKDR